jgi:hypothetical protein
VVFFLGLQKMTTNLSCGTSIEIAPLSMTCN